MDAKELRIGNLLNYQASMSVKQGMVTSISKNKISIDDSFAIKLNSQFIYPIVLTEVMLIDLGFKKECQMDDTFILGHIGMAVVAGDSNQFQLAIKGKCIIRIIKFLHELQNVWQALTGEELEIKI